MRVCRNLHIDIYTCTRTHTHTHTHTHTYTHQCERPYIYICVCIFTTTYAFTYISVVMHKQFNTNIYLCVSLYIYICTHVHIYTCTHTHNISIMNDTCLKISSPNYTNRIDFPDSLYPTVSSLLAGPPHDIQGPCRVNVSSCQSANTDTHMCRDSPKTIYNEFVLAYPAMSCISCLSNLDSYEDGRYVAAELLFCGV